MVACIILFDNVHPNGVFVKYSTVNVGEGVFGDS